MKRTHHAHFHALDLFSEHPGPLLDEEAHPPSIEHLCPPKLIAQKPIMCLNILFECVGKAFDFVLVLRKREDTGDG